MAALKTDLLLIVPFQEISAFGPRLIEGYLKKHDFNTLLVFFKKRQQEGMEPTAKEISLLKELVRETDPMLVGLSVMSPFNHTARQLTSAVRKVSSAPIIWGGVHPTICPESCIEVADICCRGEGEEPIRLILESLQKGKGIATDTPNCWVKNGDEVVQNDVSYLCTELDTLPMPELTHENRCYIEHDELVFKDPYLDYIQQHNKYYFKAFRGCPFFCTYCGNKAIIGVYSKKSKFYRHHSVDRIIEELKDAIKKFPNINRIYSFDEVFINNIDFTKEFTTKYKKEINLPFGCDTHLSLLNEENVRLMAEAGLETVAVGIQSLSEETRQNLYKRKDASTQRILEKVNLLHRHGVRVSYDFIWDNPLEREEMVEQGFWELAFRLPRPCTFEQYSLSFLPKSELAEKFIREGIIKESDVVGVSEKGLVQWKVTAGYERPRWMTFWIAVMRLYGAKVERVRTVPKCIVWLAAKSGSLRVVRLMELCVVAMQMAVDGVLLSKLTRKLVPRSKLN